MSPKSPYKGGGGIPIPFPSFPLSDNRPKIRTWLIEDTTRSKWFSTQTTYFTALPRDIRSLMAQYL